MKSGTFSVLASLATIHSVYAATGQLGDAIKYTSDPPGVAYIAEFPKDHPVKGGIIATSAEGAGTEFTVNFSNLPVEGGPFLYHIHVNPIPADGNCTEALGHLDPWIRGETPACDPTQPQTCQVGDLSGKYGTMNTGTTFQASYTDPFVTLTEGQGAFFGNRSFVIHFANTTRYTCGNFLPAQKALGGNFPHPSGPRKPNTAPPKVTRTIVAGNSPVPTPGLPNGPGFSNGGFPSGGFPTGFPGGPGGFAGYGKPAIGGGPDGFSIPDGGDLTSLFSDMSAGYSSFWATASPSTSAYAAMPTITDMPSSSVLVSSPGSAASTDGGDLPTLPSTVTASGFNISTSILPSGSRTPVPAVFNDDAGIVSAGKFFTFVVALMAAAWISS